MSKRRREPRYVGLAARGPDGLYFQFPDLPGFTLGAAGSPGVAGYIQELKQLQDHLDEMKAQGHAVPEPTPVREVMAAPANRQPHRVFDLGELRTIQRTLTELAEARRALDEQDEAESRRYVAFYGEDDFLAGELDFEPHPGLSLVTA